MTKTVVKKTVNGKMAGTRTKKVAGGSKNVKTSKSKSVGKAKTAADKSKSAALSKEKRKRALKTATNKGDDNDDRVRLVTRFARRHEHLTGSFVKAALKLYRSSLSKVEKLDEYRKLVRNNLQTRIKDLAPEDPNRERYRKQAEKKLASLDRIAATFKGDKPRYFLKPEDEAYLAKIRLPKPLSGYMMFASVKREEIKKAWEAANPSTPADFGTIGRQIGEHWKALDVAAHEDWNNKAKARNVSDGLEKKSVVKKPVAKPAKADKEETTVPMEDDKPKSTESSTSSSESAATNSVPVDSKA